MSRYTSPLSVIFDELPLFAFARRPGFAPALDATGWLASDFGFWVGVTTTIAGDSELLLAPFISLMSLVGMELSRQPRLRRALIHS